MTITAAADGSALGNPGPAGWAWYVDDSCWAAGGWKHATNNQGELKAVLELFRATAHLDDDLLVLCDSQYVINSITKWMPGWKRKGWKKADGKAVMNIELLKELDEVLAGRRYRFEWVKGHANHPLNEAADSRARAVSEAFQRGLPIPAGPGWVRAGDPTPSVSPAIPAASASAASTAQPSSAAPASAPAPEALGLFDFADFSAESSSTDSTDTSGNDPDDSTTLSITLTSADHARLVKRAHERGVGIEEFLRSLI
ncbi:RNase H family protein [Leifsonia sp. A12D58]|uniref:RNase H family protein n=1 Tax=Leifsonia sp. A12D58 TaxID=3397674 RepID=UPI0039DF8C92